MQIHLDRPWLLLDFGAPRQVLSWSLNRPGLVEARHILWREVRDADLGPDLDARVWLDRELAVRGMTDAVALLTSRDVSQYRTAEAEIEGTRVDCIATVGLSNAERVGHRRGQPATTGTINLAVSLSTGMTPGAMLEAMSVAVSARTAAVIEHGPALSSGQTTGTGTDCVALAAPRGETVHAGLHTAVGEAVGSAVYAAVAAGVTDWMARFGGEHGSGRDGGGSRGGAGSRP